MKEVKRLSRDVNRFIRLNRLDGKKIVRLILLGEIIIFKAETKKEAREYGLNPSLPFYIYNPNKHPIQL